MTRLADDSTWTEKKKDLLRKILGKYTMAEIDNALDEATRRFGRKITTKSIEYALGSRPGRFCKRAAEPALGPVERKDREDAQKRAQREVNDLVFQLREAQARQSFLDIISGFKEPPRILAREKKSRLREMTGIVLASDWHVEEYVDPASVAGINSYNLKIAARRIERFFESIIWNFEHHRASGHVAIRDLVLWLGGDLMSGYIHEELEEANELSPTETILWLLPKLRDGIYTLLKVLQLEHLEVVCSFGNHGRTTKKKRVSTGFKNSYEWLMYNVLNTMFADEKRVHFEITASAHQYVNVYQFPLHFHHGDELKYQGGVGGLGIPYLKRIPQWDLVKPCHVHNIGHWHQLLDYGRGVINGSLIGYNAFAQSIGATPEPPQQLLYFIDSTRGKCMPTALWVEDSKR